jgi:hypothetical protein
MSNRGSGWRLLAVAWSPVTFPALLLHRDILVLATQGRRVGFKPLQMTPSLGPLVFVSDLSDNSTLRAQTWHQDQIGLHD